MDVKAGDVVMLKSGGQPMTVIEAKDDTVTCVWMSEIGDLYRETLPLSALDLLEEVFEEDDEDEEDDENGDDEDEEDDEDDAKKKRKKGKGK